MVYQDTKKDPGAKTANGDLRATLPGSAAKLRADLNKSPESAHPVIPVTDERLDLLKQRAGVLKSGKYFYIEPLEGKHSKPELWIAGVKGQVQSGGPPALDEELTKNLRQVDLLLSSIEKTRVKNPRLATQQFEAAEKILDGAYHRYIDATTKSKGNNGVSTITRLLIAHEDLIGHIAKGDLPVDVRTQSIQQYNNSIDAWSTRNREFQKLSQSRGEDGRYLSYYSKVGAFQRLTEEPVAEKDRISNNRTITKELLPFATANIEQGAQFEDFARHAKNPELARKLYDFASAAYADAARALQALGEKVDIAKPSSLPSPNLTKEVGGELKLVQKSIASYKDQIRGLQNQIVGDENNLKELDRLRAGLGNAVGNGHSPVLMNKTTSLMINPAFVLNLGSFKLDEVFHASAGEFDRIDIERKAVEIRLEYNKKVLEGAQKTVEAVSKIATNGEKLIKDGKVAEAGVTLHEASEAMKLLQAKGAGGNSNLTLALNQQIETRLTLMMDMAKQVRDLGPEAMAGLIPFVGEAGLLRAAARAFTIAALLKTGVELASSSVESFYGNDPKEAFLRAGNSTLTSLPSLALSSFTSALGAQWIKGASIGLNPATKEGAIALRQAVGSAMAKQAVVDTLGQEVLGLSQAAIEYKLDPANKGKNFWSYLQNDKGLTVPGFVQSLMVNTSSSYFMGGIGTKIGIAKEGASPLKKSGLVLTEGLSITGMALAQLYLSGQPVSPEAVRGAVLNSLLVNFASAQAGEHSSKLVMHDAKVSPESALRAIKEMEKGLPERLSAEQRKLVTTQQVEILSHAFDGASIAGMYASGKLKTNLPPDHLKALIDVHTAYRNIEIRFPEAYSAMERANALSQDPKASSVEKLKAYRSAQETAAKFVHETELLGGRVETLMKFEPDKAEGIRKNFAAAQGTAEFFRTQGLATQELSRRELNHALDGLSRVIKGDPSKGIPPLKDALDLLDRPHSAGITAAAEPEKLGRARDAISGFLKQVTEYETLAHAAGVSAQAVEGYKKQAEKALDAVQNRVETAKKEAVLAKAEEQGRQNDTLVIEGSRGRRYELTGNTLNETLDKIIHSNDPKALSGLLDNMDKLKTLTQEDRVRIASSILENGDDVFAHISTLGLEKASLKKLFLESSKGNFSALALDHLSEIPGLTAEDLKTYAENLKKRHTHDDLFYDTKNSDFLGHLDKFPPESRIDLLLICLKDTTGFADHDLQSVKKKMQSLPEFFSKDGSPSSELYERFNKSMRAGNWQEASVLSTLAPEFHSHFTAKLEETLAKLSNLDHVPTDSELQLVKAARFIGIVENLQSSIPNWIASASTGGVEGAVSMKQMQYLKLLSSLGEIEIKTTQPHEAMHSIEGAFETGNEGAGHTEKISPVFKALSKLKLSPESQHEVLKMLGTELYTSPHDVSYTDGLKKILTTGDFSDAQLWSLVSIANRVAHEIPNADASAKAWEHLFSFLGEVTPAEASQAARFNKIPGEVIPGVMLGLKDNPRAEEILKNLNSLFGSVKSVGERETLIAAIIRGDKNSDPLFQAAIVRFFGEGAKLSDTDAVQLTQFLRVVDLGKSTTLSKDLLKAINKADSLGDLVKQADHLSIEFIAKDLKLPVEEVSGIARKWGGIQEIVAYLNTVLKNREGTNGERKSTLLNYVGEILEHSAGSPAEWKKWRYDTSKAPVAEQLRGLSAEQVKTWSSDVVKTANELVDPAVQRERLLQAQAALRDILNNSNDPLLKGIEQFKGTVDSHVQLERITHTISSIEAGGFLSVLTPDYISTMPTKKSTEQLKGLATLLRGSKAESLGVRLDHLIKTDLAGLHDFLKEHSADIVNVLNVLKKGGDPTLPQDIKTLSRMHAETRAGQLVTEFLNLSPADAQKSASLWSDLLQSINRARSSGGKESVDLLIKTVQEKLYNKTDTTNDLLFIASDDPRLLWRVGKYPIGSCQLYDGGSFNESLMGYVGDAHTKVVFAFSKSKLPLEAQRAIESGDSIEKVVANLSPDDIARASVARRIVKLAEDSVSGERAIFLSSPYPVSVNEGVLMMLNDFCVQGIAKPMQLPALAGPGRSEITIPSSRSPEGQYEDGTVKLLGVVVGRIQFQSKVIYSPKS